MEVRRSARRRRTVSAYREGDRIVVLIPARMSRAQEAEWVETMVARVEKAEARRRPGDDDLLRRATALSREWLDGRAEPLSVRWVDNQRSRWGSCTPADRTIRLSRRLQDMPAWVVDYVLVHELAHLLEAGHNPRFWALVDALPAGRAGQGLARWLLLGRAAGGRSGTPSSRRSRELSARLSAAASLLARRRVTTGAGQGDQLHQVGFGVGQRVGRPPGDVQRLVADRQQGVGRGDRHEADVEVVDVAGRAAEGTACSLSCTGTGSRTRVASPDSSVASRYAAPAREPSAGSMWPPSWNQRRALACRVSSTCSPSALSTRVLAVRWSGRQARVSPSGRCSRCAT